MSRSPLFDTTTRWAVLVALSATSLACAPEARLVVRGAELNADNGVSLNGVSLNGVSLNGVSLNGVSLNGVSLNGVSLNGVSLNGVSLNGSKLQYTGMQTPGQLQGARLVGSLSNGQSLSLRVDAVRQGASPNTDVFFYKVSYTSDGSGWTPLCGTHNGAAVEAIPLKGRWDYGQGTATGGAWIDGASTITFGCVNTALGKCVNFGYKPWATKNGTSLQPYHQACTRMLRADYCGDGRAFTVDGTQLNLYDRLLVQLDTEPWLTEAEWSASGATCVREDTLLRLGRLGIATPSCVTSRRKTNCGAFDANDGSLLITEYVQPMTSTDPITLPLETM